ncbi:cytochrome P450 [Streptomyces tsukubensis]|uniref:Cytochrome n=1 Tax=Streptomyces tsukubensis TaxID=83656 RepID=A0A1V4A147_9ACTN|nr:cytochrome P450 [Streptomyces tsukubensis]OON72074.1 cytochrome [Streptomyces tsukubensis]QFR93296.1 cytochrome P450 [Streptomyces tsukubensis]
MTEVPTPVVPDLDFPLSRRGDTVPAECAWLRRKRPVARVRTMTGDLAWLVSTHELATRVLQDDTFSMLRVGEAGAPSQYAPTFPVELRNSMARFSDDGLRGAIMKAVSPPVVAASADGMRRRADELIDALVADGPPLDFKQHFTDPYTVSVMCAVLGLPDTDWRSMLACLDITIMTAPEPFEGARANWDKGIARMTTRLREPGAVRAAGLLGSLARLREADSADPVPDDVLAMALHTLFEAGAASAATFLLHATLLLMCHPEQADALRDHPEHLGTAVEELLRHNLSIGDGLPRIATRDIRLGDADIKEGDLVLVLVEGANHDPTAFTSPERLDLRRTPNPHLSFGAGSHYCPATTLARAHADIALEAVLRRLPDLRLAIPVEQLNWRTGWIKRTCERLPVLW